MILDILSGDDFAAVREDAQALHLAHVHDLRRLARGALSGETVRLSELACAATVASDHALALAIVTSDPETFERGITLAAYARDLFSRALDQARADRLHRLPNPNPSRTCGQN